MLTRTRLLPANTNVRVRPIALPPEHGAWGFLFEPLVLSLSVAPSWAGAALALAVIGAFLSRQPLKIAYNDYQRGKRYARTGVAERFVALYGLVAVTGTILAVALGGIGIVTPLLLAVPVAAVQLVSYLWNRGREALPELAGAASLAIAAPAIALAGDMDPAPALGLWAVLLARDIPSILYVRARLRLERGNPIAYRRLMIIHAIALAAVLLLTALNLTPVLAAVAIGILTARAAIGLSRWRQPRQPRAIGFQEIGYGIMVVVLTATGAAANL